MILRQFAYVMVFVALCSSAVARPASNGPEIYAIVPSNASVPDDMDDTPDWLLIKPNGEDLKDWRLGVSADGQETWKFPLRPLSDSTVLVWASGEHTVRGGIDVRAGGYGLEAWNQEDGCRFDYMVDVTDTVEMTVQVASLMETNRHARAGIMMRAGLRTAEEYIAVFANANSQFEVHVRRRNESDGSLQRTIEKPETSNRFPNTFLRLVRTGSRVQAWVSRDSTYWNEQVLDIEFESALPFLGLCTASRTLGVRTRAVYRNFRINQQSIEVQDLMSAELDTEVQGSISKAQDFHTSFRLSRAGGSVFLYRPSGLLHDEMVYDSVRQDIAIVNDSLSYTYAQATRPFDELVPFERVLANPRILPASSNNVDGNVVVSASVDQDVVVRYTSDGTIPTEHSEVFGTEQELAQGVYRFRAYADNAIPSEVVTRVYMQTDYDVDVVHLVGDPYDLTSEQEGLLLNTWFDHEVDGHVVIVSPTDSVLINQGTGVKLHGKAGSRVLPQKSLRLYGRQKFGNDRFAYPFFGDNGLQDYKRLIIRNGGQDWDKAFIRDIVPASLLKDVGLDVRAWRPCVMLVNGEFWGFYNIRERIDRFYIADNNEGVNDKNVSLLEYADVVIDGTNKPLRLVLDSLREMQSSSQFKDIVERNFDVDNLCTYVAAQLLLDNRDWPINNREMWRATDVGRWRWVLFDTDISQGFNYYFEPASSNGFHRVFSEEDTHGTNPPWSTELFRLVLLHDDFKSRFVNRYLELHQETMTPGRYHHTIDSCAQYLQELLPKQSERWGGQMHWTNFMDTLHMFADVRSEYAVRHVQEFMEFSAPKELTLDVFPVESGVVRLHSTIHKRFPVRRHVFQEAAVEIEAIPLYGYRFVRWSDGYTQARRQVEIETDQELKAEFEVLLNENRPIVISEILYRERSESLGDWLELFNPNSWDINIQGMQIVDELGDTLVNVVSPTRISAGGYVVFAKNARRFDDKYSTICIASGSLNRGLRESGTLKVYSPDGKLWSTLSYSGTTPWPHVESSRPISIQRKDARLNSNNGADWIVSYGIGETPGQATPGSNSWQVSRGVALRVSPNPATSVCTVEVDTGKILDVCVYTVDGRRVNVPIASATNERSVYIQAHAIASGTYVIHVEVQTETDSNVSLTSTMVKM